MLSHSKILLVKNIEIFGVMASSMMFSLGGMLFFDLFSWSDMFHRRVDMSLHYPIMISPLHDISAPVPYSNSSRTASTIIDVERRLFIMPQD